MVPSVTGKAKAFIIATLFTISPVAPWSCGTCASAAEPAVPAEKLAVPPTLAPDETPLAGRAYRTSFMGKEIEVPPRDRVHLKAVTFGVAYGTPKVGNVDALPIFNLFLKHYWADSRTRDSISLFVNDLEYEKGKGPLELVARFENYTLPVDIKEVFNNREIKSSSLYWGTLIGSLGPGLSFPVPPYEIDNLAKLQLLANVGYFYAKKSSDTGPDVVVPPDTMLYGAKLRGRYDGMIRNLLELPHRGIAAGFDLDFTHRDRWSDFRSTGTTVFTKAHTRDYLQFTGYAMAVGDIPYLSEKNRLMVSVHGGTTKTSSVDRFNAFRVIGGPYPTESEDIFRPDYEGTMFNNIQLANYLLTAVEYRRQLAFFTYLGIRGSYITADEATLSNTNEIHFIRKDGIAVTANLDTGFFWNSSLHLAYSYDFGFTRYGKPGSGVLLSWNKEF